VSTRPTPNPSRRKSRLTCAALAATATLLGCASSITPAQAAGKLSGAVKIDGSSTVFPFGEVAADLFGEANPDVQVTVGESGTGGGFKKFCNGEIDLSAASRPIKEEEIAACKAKGITYDQITIANDGIAIVVNPSNKVACLTVAQLKKIWDQGSKVQNWKEVDPKFADLPLKLFGAGTASGTFDYFTEAINGKAKQSRADYNATEDDNVTVRGVAGTKGGLGYFGLSYAELNKKKVKTLGVDSGNGKCVVPSTKTVQDGSYKPLSRPLFYYANASSLKQPQVLAFTEFMLENLDSIAKQALFVPLTAPQKAASKKVLDGLKAKG
jgi:phosphate transport system substrate-binding protein